MVECVIVGGGLIGMLTAKELVEAGARVTLVDKGEVGRESSWAGGGILSPLYPWRYDDSITRLAQWSQAAYPRLCQELHETTGIDPQLIVSGLLMLDVEDRVQANAWADRFGYMLEDVSSTDLLASEPSLVKPSAEHGHLLMPTIGQVRNPRLLAALRKWLELHDVTICEHRAVSSLLHRGQHVYGVATSQGALEADAVIVTSGAWSKGVLSSLGVDINIFPVQGQMLLFQATPGLLHHIVMKEGFYLIPRKDGLILAGSTVEHRGFDKQVTTSAYDQLKQSALALLPGLANYPVVKHWAGLRPGSEKGIPYIGSVPVMSGLYVNCGHFRNGVVMGAASARLLADVLFNREPIIDSGDYSLIEQPGCSSPAIQ